MELEEDEAQVCRLCGQAESMFIDVFGEEGTKRFLNFKIQSKINILIDERDPLPKAICVQCLGKLEFVCDFQEECLRTQQLLRDQYSLPPLSDIEENKPEENKSEDTAPSTSTSLKNNIASNESNNTEDKLNSNGSIDNNINNNNNNNNTDKNFNPPDDEHSKDDSSTISKNATKSQRSLRSQQNQLKSSNSKKESLQSRVLDSNKEVSSSIQQPEITTTTRRLRSRQSIVYESEGDSNVKNAKRASITKKRLRSHNNTVDSTTNSKSISDANENAGKKNQGEQNNKIQIPTNTLNKVLTAITNAPGIGICVKESATNRTANDAEDTSFTVELCKKQETESLTVLAKVFPDQGSCLVDDSIVTFLEDGTNEEVKNLVNNIVSPTNSKDETRSLIVKLQNAEDITNSARNPEELFKMDGEEIHVDENVEQVNENNQVSYACKLCRKIYERKDKCTVHVKTHLGIKQYMCILCQAKFVCKSDVMKHIRCSHTNPRPISCPECPKRFRSKFDLAEHNNVHKGVKPYQCADCDQSYHHKVSLQMHVKSHMPPQNLACEYCGKIFPYRTRLLSHIGSVHMKERRNFRCRFCYNLYSSLSVLNEHIKTRHTTTYTCETCNKTFKVASKYKAHVLQHSNPKPFLCKICNNRYASKAFLNEHILKHQGVRKHVCQKCGAAFAQASHLAAHRHVHEEKTHACPECGKMFNRRDNMKVHRRRHLMPDEENDCQTKKDVFIKPNDGLPQVICMRCLGTLEFLCDFHSMCHNTQKDLGSTVAEGESNNKKPKDKLENDAESDKENVLPISNEKPKGKSTQSTEDQTKLSVSTEEDEENMAPKEQTVVGNDEIAELPKYSNKVNKNAAEKILPNDANLQMDQTCESVTTDTVLKKPSRSTRLTKKVEKKINNKSKASPVGNKIKTNKGKKSSKTIDKYFATPAAQSKNKRTNVENVNPNQTESVSKKKSAADKDAEQNKVIFEGTVINTPGDTSIIMPLKTGSFNSQQLRLEDAEMADGSEIVQAQEIVWISTDSQLPEPGKPKTINSRQSKTATSPAPGDEAEIMKMDGTLIVQTSGQDMDLTTSTEKVIVLEVQLPAKEISVALPKGNANLNRNRSVSNVSSRKSSEGRFAKISELMTDEQKQNIETLYTIDMTLVDVTQVNKNVITLAKCKFQCKICDVIYQRLDKCQVHIWRHLDMKPYICKACDFSTLTVSNIRCHIRKSHLKIKPFLCHICNKSYNSTTLLEEHLNIHTGARPYQCDSCQFASTSKQVLAHHILIHKKEKDIKCDVCGKGFYSNGRMKAHKIIHNKEKAFKCKLCSTYVLHEEALERHVKNVHTKDYACNMCDKVYKSKKALHNHESVHADAKFGCPVCSNVYKSIHILKEHILKHQGIRRYKCNKCSKAFAQQSHLAAHMAVHSDIRYDCPGCKKGFNRHDNMKVHARRCKLFLANPALQGLLVKRKISFSKNKTAKVSAQRKNNNLAASKRNIKISNSDSKKTVSQETTVKALQSNDNDNNVNVVENVLSSQEF